MQVQPGLHDVPKSWVPGERASEQQATLPRGPSPPRCLEPGMFHRHRMSKEDDLRKSRQN